MEEFKWFKNPEDKNKLQKKIDLSKSNDDTLEEDYNIRRIIGKKEDVENTENLAKMNVEALDFQDKQKEYFTDLKEKLYNISTEITKQESLLNELNEKNEKKKELNKENFRLHNNLVFAENFNESDKLEKEINVLSFQIKALENKILEEDITEESVEKLRDEYEKLNTRYETLEKSWFPQNPSLN
ncbi:MAG: hypothetical protein KBD14_02375 [Candidatus Pacebacteria bacterium]|nr:hypothetical protein [Candidatus Paceibacterota bacterium]